ncbi:YopX family protein [Bacillus cereus group sp. N21]|uniref:YopX family protein n=1 Tax=Bacillus cereus group sp. N21 TaxID=2794591 RepID=UPI0018F7447F|nr:YopX family protein [Bacillus cereus group sp. N21]MBJ8031986.1 hypothetical protein [Bacillus cereus group sp. N21]
MREIKFRGKPIEDYGDTKWLYGSAIMDYEDKLAYIEANYQGCVPVEWETVSQYTGLKDNKNVPIYEGDIVYHERFNETSEIAYSGKEMCFIGIPCEAEHRKSYFDGYIDSIDLMNENLEIFKCEVIGNIYENPELLKGGKGE